MTEALTRTQPGLAEIERMADYCVKSKLFNVQTKEQAVALMLLCEAKGLHPMEAVERFHIIQGRHSMRADAMLAEFQRRGGKIKWIKDGRDGIASATFMCDGLSEPYTHTYTIEDAKKAGLTNKDNWRKDEPAMLRARCITGGIRAADPGVNQGAYIPDEVESFNARPEVDVTPAKPASAGRLSLATVTQQPVEVEAEVVPEAAPEPPAPYEFRPIEPEAPAYADPLDVLKAIKALQGVGVTSRDDLYSIFGGDPETLEIDVDHTPVSALDYAREQYRKRAPKKAKTA